MFYQRLKKNLLLKLYSKNILIYFSNLKDEQKHVEWISNKNRVKIIEKNVRSKTLTFNSLNINDTGIYKCQFSEINPHSKRNTLHSNEIVVEIKHKHGLYYINWFSSSSPEINLDLSSATDYFGSQLNPYVREFNTDLNIECLDSLGKVKTFFFNYIYLFLF